MRMVTLILVILVVCLCSTGFAQEKKTQQDKPIFCIGIPDGQCCEFGMSRIRATDFLKAFPKPVEYTVGKSALEDWPCIHPSTNDKWAGSRTHIFTIKFTSDKPLDKPCFLIIGLADAHPADFSTITVTVNGKEIGRQPAPRGMGLLVSNISAWADPRALVFKVPEGILKAGENSIGIRLQEGSWIFYDYVLLSLDAKPPLLDKFRDDLIQEALKGPMATTEDIVFAVRKPGRDGHWYANFGYWSHDVNRKLYDIGGRLCRLNLRTGKLTTLLEDVKGGVRDPIVHYDGRKILFSYRKGDSPYYHLYEINADGTGLRQLTDGPYDDIEPTYLPDGDIIFCSSRCNRWVNCWFTQVAVLYRCGPDGKNIRMLSSNNEHDNTPWMSPDGRVLYTRWEYVDRSQVLFHHLWVMNPDGTSQMTFYGNQAPGTVMIDAKPIPGTAKVVASFSPGHGRNEHNGVITIVDPRLGPDAPTAAVRVSRGADFRDPYPLSENLFLVARWRSLLLMDRDGAIQVIYDLPDVDARGGFQCHEPRPLMSRPREPLIAPRVNVSKETGRLILVDVNYGRKMYGVKRGEIKKLLVLETLPKPINFSGGMEPLSYGGTFTLERILGTVPVEPDGSAYMELPALRSLFFVALDENDLSVKRMQSFLTVQPGEITSCAGCHEPRTFTQPLSAANLLALRRPPSQIEPISDVPEVFEFPRDIQPILDKHCLKCHDYDKRSGGVILSGDHGPLYSHSYCTLFIRGQVADGRNGLGNRPPRSIGSSASPLLKKLSGEHHGVKASPHEMKMVRLWIESGAPYPGTYAALGTGMLESPPYGYLVDLERMDRPGFYDALQRRCGECHRKQMGLPDPTEPAQKLKMLREKRLLAPHQKFSAHLLYNLSRPEKSLLLLAPLSKSAGGYGLCAGKKEPKKDVFADTNDPDYKVFLATMREYKAELEKIKRFDMPGFRPNEHYVREMKRYGILPASLPPDAPVDVYATDRAYWRSLWYRPHGS